MINTLFSRFKFLVPLLIAALSLAAPLPAHAQFGDEGTPILTVESYSTDPSPVGSEQGFTLTVTVKNVGTKHADGIAVSVSSGQFVQMGSSPTIEKLDPGFSATVTLQVRAPTLSTGAYDLPLVFTYRIGTSGEYSTTRSVGIAVAGQGGGVTGQPQVVVESITPVTTPEVGGGAFDVNVVFRNVGARKAYNVSTTLQLNEHLSPAQGSGSAQVGDLAAGEAVTHTLRLVLNKAHPSGRITQTFRLEYRDSDNTPYTSDESASLEIGAAARQSPQLILSGYHSEPEQPAPGEAFTLTLQLTNVGAGTASRVLARLGGDSGLEPFIPLESGNVVAAPDVQPGETITLTQTLLMDGAAAGGAYALDIGLSYENALGESKSDSATLGVLALYRPQLQMGLTKAISDGLTVGQTFDIALEVINIGRQRVEVSTVEIVSDDLALTKNSLYVGPLDPSISGALTAKATALKEGTATARIVVHYRDELNRMQTIVKELTFEIVASSGFAPTPQTTTPPASASSSPWALFLRFLGLGG